MNKQTELFLEIIHLKELKDLLVKEIFFLIEEKYSDKQEQEIAKLETLSRLLKNSA